MLFKPAHGMLWDTLLYENSGTYHLFFLSNGDLGHAVSSDLAHWAEQSPVSLKKDGTWYENGIRLTGSIIKKDGRFFYAVGNIDHNGSQVYGFAVSDDLFHWEMIGEEPILTAKLPYASDNTPGLSTGWRDPFFRLDEEGWIHVYLCAHMPVRDHTTSGAVIAHLRSKDLMTWDSLPPIAHMGHKVRQAECPSVIDIGGKWYALFLDHGWGGMRWHTNGYEDSNGTYYMTADDPDGPYKFDDHPLLLGAGGDRQESWAGRAVKIGGKWLLYSHLSGSTAFANIKEIVQTPDGGLALKYYPAIEKRIEGQKTFIDHLFPAADDLGVWECTDGTMTGRAEAMGSGAGIVAHADSFILEADVSMDHGAALGFALRTVTNDIPKRFPEMPDMKETSAVVIRLDFELGRAEIEKLFRANYEGYGRNHLDIVVGGYARNFDHRSMELLRHKDYRVKILARGPYYELYIGDILIFCKYIDHPVEGGMEILTERGKAYFRNIGYTKLTPM